MNVLSNKKITLNCFTPLLFGNSVRADVTYLSVNLFRSLFVVAQLAAGYVHVFFCAFLVDLLKPLGLKMSFKPIIMDVVYYLHNINCH